ncbi:centromere protein L [Platysternon megacephalum]|uniref:Alkylhydroperoxidase n=1 Tax=Platysternon megacephalum TaxID=55544 RepID=A0A4D9DJS6_9SAUR|nr:alkylhydroperoxidase [Platysternon megacephalum]TFK07835.1 centromere protein L [Platysternon megacephalum]
MTARDIRHGHNVGRFHLKVGFKGENCREGVAHRNWETIPSTRCIKRHEAEKRCQRCFRIRRHVERRGGLRRKRSRTVGEAELQRTYTVKRKYLNLMQTGSQ